ncbi:MAG TPA: uroporphyrinogen decarboxylase family protein [Candidatus Sulfotelmatobacter sp.]|nr:uroporphyrinogen decarboxylase family protein [Candidatus Sulfotelmatobacter sp.]
MNNPAWTSRRRVEAALNHQEPDRVPYDLGGTILTGIHQQAYRRLRKYLGLPEVEIQIEDPVQQLALVHEDVKQRLQVDVYGINPSKARGVSRPPWSEEGYDKLQDEWGIEWWKPQQGGFYFDMRRHPLAEVDTIQGLAQYQFPDPLDPGRFEDMAQRADELMNQRQVGYVLGRNAPGIFEIALWMRGFENFYCDMVANQAFAEALLDTIMEVKMRYWERALQLVGSNVMMVSEADDLASQNRCLVSPELYRKLIKPRHTQLFSFIKRQARVPVKIFYHSCGAVSPILPDLIESGIDVLNPVQVSAAGMDTKELKKRFGKDITFYGGGVDTQHILPQGTPQQVRDEVKRRVEDLAPGGGFIFNTVHNIQSDVPPENIVAMWEAVREFGSYAG